jgi:hypothetical protein
MVYRAGSFLRIPPALETPASKTGERAMLDRRQRFRGRVCYGGLISFNERQSTMTCVVRNFSPMGARIEFTNASLLPDEIDFTILRKALSCRARIVWREANEAGLAFSHPKQTSAPIPLDWAIRLRASERDRKELRRRIADLLSER